MNWRLIKLTWNYGTYHHPERVYPSYMYVPGDLRQKSQEVFVRLESRAVD